MKFSIRYFFMLVIIAMSVACKKDNYKLYSGEPRIQFGPPGGVSYLPSYELEDTLKAYTFFYRPAEVQQDTVFFDVLTTGGPKDKDRPFLLEQVPVAGVNNAVPDIHYQDFSSSTLAASYVMKAGQVHTRIPVVLLRHPSLKTKTATLKLQVKANEQFQLGEERMLWRKVVISDMISRPSAWDAFGERYLWGKYSNVKHRFMIEQTGQRWDQAFFLEVTAEVGLQEHWRQKLKTLLADYSRIHGEPLKDEDNAEVKFP